MWNCSFLLFFSFLLFSFERTWIIYVTCNKGFFEFSTAKTTKQNKIISVNMSSSWISLSWFVSLYNNGSIDKKETCAETKTYMFNNPHSNRRILINKLKWKGLFISWNENWVHVSCRLPICSTSHFSKICLTIALSNKKGF